MDFKQLKLIDPLLKAIVRQGYTTPTPIQQQAIPHVLEGRDLLGLAQTGTGKTAAFALPILQRLEAMGPPPSDRRIRVLVLTPTRELAAQIGESFAAYGADLPFRHTVIFGGVGQRPQEQALRRGMDILVATPGRLLDLMQQRYVHLQHLQIFVLDEADRMLDMGFIHDVKKVIAALPKQRQTLFFSATMPPEVDKLAQALLTNPARVAVTPVSSTAERIEQRVYHVDHKAKQSLLTELLQDKEIKRTLVFTRTKHGANRVAEKLTNAGVYAEAIHGNKSQSARERALDGFKTGRLRVLVATDLAARGIDVDEISHVINFDVPNVPETYVHRIGRTARAGASGIAMSFMAADERPFIADIERLTKRKIPVEPLPAFEMRRPPSPDMDSRPPRPEHRSAGRGGRASGGRPSHGGRPSGGAGRPSGGASRPSGGANRPSGGANRPSGGASRPSHGAARPSQGAGRPSHGAARPSHDSERAAPSTSRPASAGHWTGSTTHAPGERPAHAPRRPAHSAAGRPQHPPGGRRGPSR